MGRDVERVVFTREDRRQFRDKHRRCLDVLAQMLAESQFDFEHPLTGGAPPDDPTDLTPELGRWVFRRGLTGRRDPIPGQMSLF